MNKSVTPGTLTGVVVCFIIFLSSCQHGQPDQEKQNKSRFKTYKGTVNVYADASFETIMKLEQEVFEFHYDSVKANIQYLDEAAVIEAYRKNRNGVMVLGRELDSAETAALQKADTLYIRQLDVAYDAVALIGNQDFDDNNLDSLTIRRYFDPNNQSANTPKMVFDKQSSGIVKFMLKKLGLGNRVSVNLFAVSTPDEVITYVEQNKNAIGFIPFNYLSDTDNEKVKSINERIKILSLRAKTGDGQPVRVSANQSDIAEGIYPFIRPVTAITHYGFDDDLEWLFVYFMQRGKGDKVFLKHGLIPAKRSERQIIVNTDGLKASNQ